MFPPLMVGYSSTFTWIPPWNSKSDNVLFVELYSVILLIRLNELWPANSKSDENCVVRKLITSYPVSPWRNMGPQQKSVNLSRDMIGSQGINLPPIRFFTNLLLVSTVLVQVMLFYYAFENFSSLNLAPISRLHISTFVQNVPFPLPLIPLFDLLAYI